MTAGTCQVDQRVNSLQKHEPEMMYRKKEIWHNSTEGGMNFEVWEIVCVKT